MSTSTTITLQDRLEDLFSYIREGRILDAITEFYAENAVMQENALPPTVGREANLEREKGFLSTVKEWQWFDVTAKGVGKDVTFYEPSWIGWMLMERRSMLNRWWSPNGRTARSSTSGFITTLEF
jgi:hypothetical protein